MKTLNRVQLGKDFIIPLGNCSRVDIWGKDKDLSVTSYTADILRLPCSLSGVFSYQPNSVNMRRIPANLYINGKLTKFSK